MELWLQKILRYVHPQVSGLDVNVADWSVLLNKGVIVQILFLVT